MKQKILYLVSTVIEKNDGYKTRVEFEMDILNEYFDFYMCIPESSASIIKFKHPVKYITYVTKKKGFLHKYENMISLRKAVKKVLDKDSDIIVYCEALGVALKVSNMLLSFPNKVVFDCHGTEPDEYLLNHSGIKGILYSKFLRWMEKRVVNNSDLLVTVTKKQYQLWNVNKSHVVLPSIPANHFFDEKEHGLEMRNKLGISEEKTVYVYSGQNEKWQMCEETICFYSNIEKIEEDSFLLVFTHEVKFFEELVKKYKLKHAKVLSVNFYDMPKYLDACNFGFCLRQDHIINRVASPTKVLEYISRNVKPILTDYIGDFSSKLSADGMAEIVDINSPSIKLNLILRANGLKYLKLMREEECNNYINSMRKLNDVSCQ